MTIPHWLARAIQKVKMADTKHMTTIGEVVTVAPTAANEDTKAPTKPPAVSKAHAKQRAWDAFMASLSNLDSKRNPNHKVDVKAEVKSAIDVLESKAKADAARNMTAEQSLAYDLTPEGTFLKKMLIGRNPDCVATQEEVQKLMLKSAMRVLTGTKVTGAIAGHVVNLGISSTEDRTLSDVFDDMNSSWFVHSAIDIPSALDLHLADKRFATDKGKYPTRVDDLLFHLAHTKAAAHLRRIVNTVPPHTGSLLTMCSVKVTPLKTQKITFFSQLRIHTCVVLPSGPDMSGILAEQIVADARLNMSYLTRQFTDLAEQLAVVRSQPSAKPKERAIAYLESDVNSMSILIDGFLTSSMLVHDIMATIAALCTTASTSDHKFIAIPRVDSALAAELLRGTYAMSTEEFPLKIYSTDDAALPTESATPVAADAVSAAAEPKTKPPAVKEMDKYKFTPDSLSFITAQVRDQLNRFSRKLHHVPASKDQCLQTVSYFVWHIKPIGKKNMYCLNTAVGASIQHINDRDKTSAMEMADRAFEMVPKQSAEFMLDTSPKGFAALVKPLVEEYLARMHNEVVKAKAATEAADAAAKEAAKNPKSKSVPSTPTPLNTPVVAPQVSTADPPGGSIAEAGKAPSA